jgi:peptidoglycan/LPS O-acetylase OafA/YrhL
MNNQRISRLDIIRGVSILFVFVFHLSQAYVDYSLMKIYDLSQFIPTKYIKLLSISPIAHGGTIGVFMFFLLSGYLIHLKYSENKSFNFLSFYTKRFWRIAPVYYIVLTLLFLYYQDKINDLNTWNYLIHIFFAHNLYESAFYSINPSFWSIAVEIQFYLIFPLLLFLYKKQDLLKVFLLLLFVSFLIFIVNFTENVAILSTFKFIFIWVFGGVLSKYQTFIQQKITPIFSSKFVLVTLIIYSLINYVFYQNINIFFYYFVSFLISVILFIYVLYNNSFTKCKIAKNVSKKFFMFLGMCSYSFYLIHQPFISYIHKYKFINTPNYYLNIVIESSLIFVIILLLSYFIYILFEVKFISLGNRISKLFSN